MTTPRAPQDRKPRTSRPSVEALQAEASGGFVFEHDGQEYELPASAAYVGQVSGGDLMDAVLQGPQAEFRLNMVILRAASKDIDSGTMEVLRALPSERFVQVTNGWLQAGGVASSGESHGSST